MAERICPMVKKLDFKVKITLIEKTYGGANASLHDLRADITPSAYADYAVKWAASGAGIIGVCCGISPDHLHEVKTRLVG